MSGAAYLLYYTVFKEHITNKQLTQTLKFELFLVGIVTLTFMYGYIKQLNKGNMLVLLQSSTVMSD